MEEETVTTPLSSQQPTRHAVYSDELSQLAGATRERDDFVSVDGTGGYPSPTTSSRVPHQRPDHLNYPPNPGSQGSHASHSQDGVLSSSSPQQHRHGYSSPVMPATTSTPPTPAPRTVKVKQLEEDVSRLRHKVASLQQQNSELRGEDNSLQLRVVQLEDQNKKMKEANSLNINRLTEKISYLEVDSVNCDQTIIALRKQVKMCEEEVKRKEEEIERERAERKQIVQSWGSLKVEHERVDGERRILERERDRLKEEVRSSHTTDSSGAAGRSNSVSSRDAGVLRRLNNTLREKKQLEEQLVSLNLEVNNLKANKQTVEQESSSKIQLLQEELGRMREENERMKVNVLAKAEQEKQLLWQQVEEQRHELRKAEQKLEEREREVKDLREERDVVERQNREKVKQIEETADRQLQEYQTEMESFVEEKEKELGQVKSKLERVRAENESLNSRIECLELEVEEVKSDGEKVKTSLLSELKSVRSDRDEAQKVRNNVVGELTALKEVKKKNETLQDALKKEAEYIMTDLEEVNAKLAAAEKERDKVTHQKDKVMNELAKRNREIQVKEDHIGQLSQQLKEKEEQLTILDIQLQTYHSDFETERKAREKIASKAETLAEELTRKEAEVKQLHSHLNRSAANQMKAEMEMEFLTSQEGLGHYATANMPRPQAPPMGAMEGNQPLRARDPERTHPPQGGTYQMHTPRP